MPQHGFELFRGGAARVPQIDLMMQAPCRKIRHISLLCRKRIHLPQSLRLCVVRANMHALYAQSLVIGPEFRRRKVPVSFWPWLPARPSRTLPGSQTPAGGSWRSIQKSPCGHSPRRPHPADATILPAEAPHTQKTFHPVAALIAHFDGISKAVQHFHSGLVFPCRVVRVTLPLHCHKVHGRDRDEMRFPGWQIEFLVFFLVIKCPYIVLRSTVAYPSDFQYSRTTIVCKP